jgi:hypothetical protein
MTNPAPAEERETPVEEEFSAEEMAALHASFRKWLDARPNVPAEVRALLLRESLPAEDRAVTRGEQSGGVALIAAERARQVSAEGWSAQHDDQHETGELLAAAARYLDAGSDYDLGGRLPDWPWEPHWFKPSDDLIRNLVKAGALIAAEIDRQQRKAALIAGAEDRAVTAPQEPEELDLEAIRDFGGVILTPAETDQVSAYYYAMVAEVERLRSERDEAQKAAAQWRDGLAAAKVKLAALTHAIEALREEMEREANKPVLDRSDFHFTHLIQAWAAILKEWEGRHV